VWLSEPASFLWYLDTNAIHTKLEGAPSYSWASYSNRATFISNEVEFVDAAQVFTDSMLESLGGHPATQNAVIGLPLRHALLEPPRLVGRTGLLQVTGQLSLTSMAMMYDKTTLDSVQVVSQVNQENPPTVIFTSAMGIGDDDRLLIASLDDHHDRTLLDWLKFSNNTVWLLKFAIGKAINSLVETGVKWMVGNKNISLERLYDYGLILIPTCEDIAAIKEAQHNLEAWNLPAVPVSTHSHWDRVSSPPRMDDYRRFMHAQNRLEAYKLVGPHNSAFQRVGIYRGRASSIANFRARETNVFLA